MSTVYILVGLPGCGKSTYARSHFPGAVVISTDDIREELWGDAGDQRDGNIVFATAYKRANEAIAAGKDVVFDATNLTVATRRKVRQELRAANEFVAVYFDVSAEVCKERQKLRDRKVPEEVIDKMAKRLAAPSYDEPFTYIYWIIK